jgi:osmotically-inducible protein OsmY
MSGPMIDSATNGAAALNTAATDTTASGTAESRAQVALAKSPIHALHELQVEEHDGDLLISGSVDSFYHKQLAQEAIRSVANGSNIVNSISVR